MSDLNRVMYRCSQCDSEYISLPRRGVCLDCQSPLVDRLGVEVAPPAEDQLDALDLQQLDAYDEVEVVEAFETDNPWLRRLFAHPWFGHVPAGSMARLRDVTPDPEERLVAAIVTRHGRLSVGYFMLTTFCMRWTEIAPLHRNDFWPYESGLSLDGFPMVGGILVTADGNQFQTRWGKAKAFHECYTLMLQASVWDADHAPDDETTASVEVTDLPDQLRRLADLYEKGLLNDAEFAAAKARLIGD